MRALSAQAGWLAAHGHIGACQAAGLPHEGPGKALGAQDRVCTLLDPELNMDCPRARVVFQVEQACQST